MKRIAFALTALPGEENAANNAMDRLVTVSGDKRRILYVEGEPRWEYKFLRRAAEDDPTLQVVSMLRTTENKIYRQGIANPAELADGFPVKAEDLFGYDGIVMGSVEAGYFTPGQQELLREFVDRRGGGLLFLGGRFALSDGGWNVASVSELMPTFLPNGKGSFHRDPATAQLTPAGVESAVTRLVDDPAANAARWKKLPYMMDYQDAGVPKPGATVLAQSVTGHGVLPLLVTENYGRGRTAVMATSGTWRWQMSQALGDPTHDLFWQQMLRWVVGGSPGPVVASMADQSLQDAGHVALTATVRDRQFIPAPDAHVTAHISGPEGVSALVDLTPVLARLPQEISYSEAGISVRDTKELWNMPIVFFLLLGLMSGEWLLRRKWGIL